MSFMCHFCQDSGIRETTVLKHLALSDSGEPSYVPHCQRGRRIHLQFPAGRAWAPESRTFDFGMRLDEHSTAFQFPPAKQR